MYKKIYHIFYKHYMKHWHGLYEAFLSNKMFWSGVGLLTVGGIYGIWWLLIVGVTLSAIGIVRGT